MVVNVHLHTALRENLRSGTDSLLSLELPADSRVQDVLDRLEISFPVHGLMLVVNRKSVGPEHTLYDGDVLHLIPAISGGGG